MSVRETAHPDVAAEQADAIVADLLASARKLVQRREGGRLTWPPPRKRAETCRDVNLVPRILNEA
jgi:hypothetical protein